MKTCLKALHETESRLSHRPHSAQLRNPRFQAILEKSIGMLGKTGIIQNDCARWIGVAFLSVLVLNLSTAEERDAGDAGDASPFTFKFDSANADKPLMIPGGGRFVEPAEVETGYGRDDRFRILVDGVDIASWDYARAMGFSRPRRPVYQDLSDATGWPDVHVRNGTVAIDPRTGRFKFAEGDTRSGITRLNFLMTPHGGTHRPMVRGRILYCPNGETWAGVRVVDIADPANPRHLMTLDVGCFGVSATSLGDRMYCHANYNGTTILDLSENRRPEKIGRWRVIPNAHHGYAVLPFRLGGREYFYSYIQGDGNWKDTPPRPSSGPEIRLAKGAGSLTYEAAGKGILAKDGQAEVGRISLRGEATSLALSEDGQFLFVVIDRGTLALISCSDPKAMKRLGEAGKGKMKQAAVYATARPYSQAGLNQACLNTGGCFVAEYLAVPGRPTGLIHAFEVRKSKPVLAWSRVKFPAPGLRLVDATDSAHPVTKDLGFDFMFQAVQQSTAYRVAERETVLYDISNPEAPREAGKVAEPLSELTFSGTLLFAVSGKDLVVFDNGSSAAPREAGRLRNVEPRSLAVNGRFAYFSCKGNVLTAVDVSNPADMKLLGSASVPNTQTCGPVVLRPDGRAAIVSEEVGQWLFDLTDPAQPRLTGVYYCAGELQHLLVDPKTGIGTTCTEWGGLQVMVDLSEPLEAKIIGYYHSGEFDNYADVYRDGWMYFGKSRKDYVVDCTDPTSPKVAGDYEMEETPNFPVRFWANTGYTIGILGQDFALTTYDYSDARHPKKLGRTVLGHPCHSLATDGRRVFALGRTRLTAADVSDPRNPKVLGFLEHEDLDSFGGYSWQGSGRRLALRGPFAYSIQGSEGRDDPRIAVYNVSNPAAMKRVYVTSESRPTFQDDWFDSRILHQGDMFNDMILEGRYLYVSDYWGGVRVYDLSDPEKPVCVDFEFEPYYALVPANWNRAEYRKACASGDVEKYFGITPETWARRFEIGRNLSWTEMQYHPGYELFAWNIGELVGDTLVQPKLGGLAVYRVKRSPEMPKGKVTVWTGD